MILLHKTENVWKKQPDWSMKLEWIGYILAFFLCAFFCFYRLGEQGIELWDEARHGVNGYEMLKNGNLFVNTYLYVPDYYNLKPPLSMWGAILGYLIWGFNALGLRFFAAVSYFATATVSSLFARRKYGKTASWFVLFAFSAAEEMLSNHMGRNGDADAYLCLFLTLTMIAYVIGRENGKKRYLIGAGTALGLAFLAKGFAAGIVPIIIVTDTIIETIRDRKIPKHRVRDILIIGGVALIPIGIWAFLRFQVDGMQFISQTFLADIWKRSTEWIAGYKMPFWYYFIVGNRSGAKWMVITVLIAAVGYRIYMGKSTEKSDSNYIWLICTILPVILYSFFVTKFEWYIFPAFIGGILFGAQCIGYLTKTVKGKVIPGILVVLVLIMAMKGMYVNWNNINMVSSHGMENTLEMAKGEIPKGVRFYVEYDNQRHENEMQAIVLILEWHFDACYVRGDFGGFMKDSEAYFIDYVDGRISSSESSKDKQVELPENLEVVCGDDNYRILKHK